MYEAGVAKHKGNGKVNFFLLLNINWYWKVSYTFSPKGKCLLFVGLIHVFITTSQESLCAHMKIK